jgi:hypothetical protein
VSGVTLLLPWSGDSQVVPICGQRPRPFLKILSSSVHIARTLFETALPQFFTISL